MTTTMRCLMAVIMAFAALQFVPVRPLPVGGTGKPEAVSVNNAGDQDVTAILTRSCSDCHSSHAVLPWYGHIAPASWLLASHIQRGTQKLDFSQWDLFGPSHGQKEDICDAVSNGRMPLRSYTWVHRGAALSTQDVATVCNWAETRSVSALNGRR